MSWVLQMLCTLAKTIAKGTVDEATSSAIDEDKPESFRCLFRRAFFHNCYNTFFLSHGDPATHSLRMAASLQLETSPYLGRPVAIAFYAKRLNAEYS